MVEAISTALGGRRSRRYGRGQRGEAEPHVETMRKVLEAHDMRLLRVGVRGPETAEQISRAKPGGWERFCLFVIAGNFVSKKLTIIADLQLPSENTVHTDLGTVRELQDSLAIVVPTQGACTWHQDAFACHVIVQHGVASCWIRGHRNSKDEPCWVNQ